MKILIANRGEIARRVIRTAHRLGHATVAVYAEPDAQSPHVTEAGEAVLIGPAALAESYLDANSILAAAAATGATAIHPGYGFLSENAAFAQSVQDAGLIWIGPRPEAIEKMGSKIEARRLAEAAGVPIIPGFDTSQDPADLRAAAEQIGYPILVKASAGGGGKGIRIANSPAEFDDALSEASTEAQRAFGDGKVIVERFIQQPRHIEVQLIGDKHGGLAELGTRECSVQRRYQKVLEEAPAPRLLSQTRAGLRASAKLLGNAIAYDSAGTVEFIVDDVSGEHFFLEMNTRLQVEHPVTELVTGLDLVELMIRSAAGEELVLPDEIALSGHAIECRINAEDPANDYAPQTGTVHQLRVPDGVRWDAALNEGGTVSPFYDSMIAKLIVGGDNRDAALHTMRAALDQLIVGGIVTNTSLQRWLLDTPEFSAAEVTTRFLDDGAFTVTASENEALENEARELAAQAWARATEHASAGADEGPWSCLPHFSVTPQQTLHLLGLRDRSGGPDAAVHEHTVSTIAGAAVASATSPALVDLAAGSVAVNVGGQSWSFEIVSRTERWAASTAHRTGSDSAIVAPFPAVVAELHVGAGDVVQGDDVIVVIEAMKMLHSLRASGTGTIAEVRVAVGDQVAANQILVTFTSPEDATDSQ